MKKIKAKYFLYVFLFILIISSTVFVYYANHNRSSDSKGMSFVGKYSTDNIHWDDIESGNQLKKLKVKEIYIKGHFTENVKNGEHLWAQFHRAVVTVVKNGEIVYTNINNVDRENTPFITEWSDFEPGELLSTEELVIHIKGEKAGLSSKKFLDSIYKCDKIDLLRANLQKHILQIFIAILMLCIGTALSLTVIALCFTNNSVKKSFIFSGLFLVAGGICTLIDYNYITLLIPNKHLVNTIDYLSQCLICEFLILYIMAFLESKKLKIVSLTISIAIALSIAAHFLLPFNMNKYIKIQLPVFIGCIITTVIFLIYEYFRLHNKKTKPLLISGAVVSIFIIIEMINFYLTSEYWIVVFQFGLLLYACMQFFYLIQQTNAMIQEARDAEITKRALTEARIDIMLSQIQPHFLYNSLTSIIALCDDKTEAKKALIDFSKYLRINLDSIKKNMPQPFETELYHIKTYLSLEKMRFTEKLNIVYNIRTMNFCIPALTVQPLVENAVKHGVCKKSGNGTVIVSTYESEKDYVITIEDNGVGFNPCEIQTDGRTHIGIDNVKHRLKAMCNAELTIESEINFGTKATIKVPKGAMSE